MNKKRNGLILSILGILGLIVITAGVTYAFFNYAKEGTTDNVITTGSITFLYTEVSGVGNGISIENAYPISDEVGKVKTGEGEYFDFKITSDTFGEASIPYEVTARKKIDSTLDEEAVRMYLVDQDTNEELLLANYSDLTQTDKVLSSNYREKTIYTGKVPADTKDYEKNFRLRMWIDENIDFSQNEDGTYPYNGKTFTVTINVYANAKVVTEEDIELESNANIVSLAVNDEELTKIEDANYDYEMELAKGTTSASINIETENPYSKVSIEKVDSFTYETSNIQRLSTIKTVSLNPGNNYFKVTITSEDGNVENTYTLNIYVMEDGTLLSDAIFEKYTTIYTEPTLDTSSLEAGDEDGLYKWTDPDDENTISYYFRGNVTNNYVDFADQTWRIVRINEDGTIRLIMENGINDNGQLFASTGSYLYAYYSKSSAKTNLETWYTTNIEEKGYSDYVMTGEYYCEQAKVKGSSSTVNAATMQLYSEYTPTFKCSQDNNKYGVVNASVGLITYDEAVYAGAYKDKDNQNYYLYNGKAYWTMTPSYYVSNTKNPVVWYGSSSGDIDNGITNQTSALRPVINLRANVIVTGTGASNNHWVVQ